MKKITIVEFLDMIVFNLIEPTVGAGWTRKEDDGEFEVYEIRVPKVSE